MINVELKQTYFKLLIPFLIVLLLIYIAQITNIIIKNDLGSNRIISISLFTLAAIFSLAIPILYRTLFVSKIKDRKSITKEEFINFEKRIITIVMAAPYITIAAIFFNLPGFYFGGIILFAIYSVYYYYPSTKRIKFEKKIFRLNGQE